MTGLKLGIVKPDHGVSGGFELLLGGLVDRMNDRGHTVSVVPVTATERPPKVFDYPIAPVLREWHDEYFRYLELLEATRRLDLSGFDVVCSTQPPTYAAPHSRVFSLTYHQYRVFYDLADEFVAAGFVSAQAHKVATEAVRRMDAAAIDGNRGFLAGSDTIAGRLERFWNIGSVPYRHPNVTRLPAPKSRDRSGSDVVGVSRQEWPKRTELFVAAMHLTAAQRGGDRPTGHLVGGGSRSAFVESLDHELFAAPDILDTLGTADESGRLWRNMGIFTKGWKPVVDQPSGRVRFHGSVSERDRNRLYAEAACIVAPALDEDYGLTVLEAWQQRRPIIVCSDGGGLTELVTHGVNGLVVDPTPFAIAQAIDRLCNDPDLGDRLAEGGADSLAEITWDKALDTFEQAAMIAAGGPDPTVAAPQPLPKSEPQHRNELMAYIDGGFNAVSGWMAPAPIDAIRRLSEAQTDGGHVAEIGIHHGQLFILLALLCGADERAVGFDLFENQDENIDGSGLGDREQLEKNLIDAGVPGDRVLLETRNSMRLQPADVQGLVGGRVRLFSVDGGHTAAITTNDLWVAERTLTKGGIVILDDAFNTMWPGVGEGMHNYLRHRSCNLIPFGIVDNKTFFTNDAHSADLYREVLKTPYEHHSLRQDELYGSAMICSQFAPGH